MAPLQYSPTSDEGTNQMFRRTGGRVGRPERVEVVGVIGSEKGIGTVVGGSVEWLSGRLSM